MMVLLAAVDYKNQIVYIRILVTRAADIANLTSICLKKGPTVFASILLNTWYTDPSDRDGRTALMINTRVGRG